MAATSTQPLVCNLDFTRQRTRKMPNPAVRLRKLLFAGLMICGFAATNPAENVWGAEPGWSLRVIATGSFRDKIRSTPIEKRPYRPLHVYGNSVRRRHYRGTMLPVPRTVSDRLPVSLLPL
jgi:hypothetical protein